MKIRLNGAPHEVEAGATVAALIQQLPRKGPVAVVLNEQVIYRAQHATTPLQDGDQVELLTLAAGG